MSNKPVTRQTGKLYFWTFNDVHGFLFWYRMPGMDMNACTLVPTVFRWHGKMEFKFHFHFSFFVFAWHWKTDLNFAFRFSFSPNFQKRIWTSFFIFASLWKTDMNFVFRFHITLKNGFEFRFCMACYLKNRSEFRLLLLHDSWKTDYCTSHLKSPDTPSGFTGEFTFYAKESNWIFSSPGPKWVVNSPAPMICSPHTVLLFNKGWQIIWW